MAKHSHDQSLFEKHAEITSLLVVLFKFLPPLAMAIKNSGQLTREPSILSPSGRSSSPSLQRRVPL